MHLTSLGIWLSHLASSSSFFLITHLRAKYLKHPWAEPKKISQRGHYIKKFRGGMKNAQNFSKPQGVLWNFWADGSWLNHVVAYPILKRELTQASRFLPAAPRHPSPAVLFSSHMILIAVTPHIYQTWPWWCICMMGSTFFFFFALIMFMLFFSFFFGGTSLEFHLISSGP